MRYLHKHKPRFYRSSWVFATLFFAATSCLAQDGISRASRIAAYHARGDSLLEYMATRVPANDFGRGGYFDIAARLHLGRDVDWCVRRLDSLLVQPSGDMFWMYPFVTVMYVGRDKLPPRTTAKMRDAWRTYTPYRGDTENHWAMYYTALYLASQMYPNEPATSWFNGKTSEENFREAEEYLLSWIDLTTTIGQGEYDSPDYFNVYIVPMAQLYGFAEDPAMRRRARMMLDYLIADFAVESLNGLYVGGHSRVYPRQALEKWWPASTGYAWLLFGNVPQRIRPESLLLRFSGYQPPDILYHIATDRTQPYIHKEKKRTRHRMRFSPVKNAPVYKYFSVREEYAVASTQGGLLQPIQQKTWEVTWAVDDPRGVNNTLFTVHPYSSPIELGMYFSGPLGFITEAVVRSKTTYDSPDKWTGGSPHEQVFQHHDVVIALYDIPVGTRHPHIAGFFSKDLSVREEDRSGWILARGGNAWIGYYPLAPYEWRREEDEWQAGEFNWRLHSPHLQNGAIVQVAPASSFDDLRDFRRALHSRDLDVDVSPVPRVRYETLAGDVVEVTYGSVPTVNGVPVDYGSWKLFEGPFLWSEVGSRELTLRYGNLRRTLDFNTLTITDWVEPARPPESEGGQ